MSSHGYGPAFERARRIVLLRDGYTCHWCGGPARTADHVVPRVEGGSDGVENLVAACQRCNSRRSLEWVRARARRLAAGRSFFKDRRVPRESPAELDHRSPASAPVGALAAKMGGDARD